jgi:hypothetical protein
LKEFGVNEQKSQQNIFRLYRAWFVGARIEFSEEEHILSLSVRMCSSIIALLPGSGVAAHDIQGSTSQAPVFGQYTGHT